MSLLMQQRALDYFARTNGKVLALLGFGAAAWKTAPRDDFIGWTPEQRERNLHLVVNNARFLILPCLDLLRSYNFNNLSKGLTSEFFGVFRSVSTQTVADLWQWNWFADPENPYPMPSGRC